MSGGSFGYAYYSAEAFAIDLKERLALQGTRGPDDFEGELQPQWTAPSATAMREIAEAALVMARLMKEVEWLYSCDTGEEEFMSRVKEILAEAGE